MAVIHASLHGKVPRLDKYEDILTSNVFSALRYCSNPDLLMRLMQIAVDHNCAPMPLDHNEAVKTTSYFFWPKLNESEPDVLIALERVSGNIDLICVEVKYLSGKSGEDSQGVIEMSMEATRDQLARQYRDLDALRRGAFRIQRLGPINKTFLVYLTLDAAIPIAALEATRKSMPPGGQVYWLSWRSFPDAVATWSPSNDIDRLIRCDLMTYLQHKALRTDIKFELEPLENQSWAYAENVRAVVHPLWELRSVAALKFEYDKDGGGIIGEYFRECQTIYFKCSQYRG